jgi:hypothetical protein
MISCEGKEMSPLSVPLLVVSLVGESGFAVLWWVKEQDRGRFPFLNGPGDLSRASAPQWRYRVGRTGRTF